MTVYRNRSEAVSLAALLTARDEDGWRYSVRRAQGGYVISVRDGTGARLGDL